MPGPRAILIPVLVMGGILSHGTVFTVLMALLAAVARLDDGVVAPPAP